MSATASTEVSVAFDVPVEMRDGVVLRADVYSPASSEPLPVVLLRHPYSKSRMPLLREVDAMRVARSGYILVVQDVRGRFGSEGVFTPSIHEVEDGVDTVRWAAGLPGSNGVVGMWGSSYAAETQWSAAIGGDPLLRSIIPINSPSHSHFIGYLMRGGVREFGNRLGWWHRAISFEELRRAEPQTPLTSLFEQFATAQDLLDREEIYRLRPFQKRVQEISSVLAQGTEIFTADPGAAWRHSPTTAGKYDGIRVPAFIVGGWFDCFLGSTISQYLGIRRAAEAGSGRPPHLVMGPWSHRSSDYQLGDLHFGLEARAAMPVQDQPLTDQIIRWFDTTLKGRDDALADVPPVRLYLMGTNTWLGFESYPPSGTGTQSWFLGQNGGLSTVPVTSGGEVWFAYDPEDPVPTLGGPILMAAEFPEGPRCQDSLYSRDDIVSFVSQELERPLHVVGRVTATLHVVTDAIDTDFVVSVCDVQPDGRSILIVNGILRLSARNSYSLDGEYLPDAENPPVAGQDLEIQIGLLDTAYTFATGHRIRVDITSSSFPRWDCNPNTGSTIFDSADGVVAHQVVKFGGIHASRIDLPVLRDEVVSAAVLRGPAAGKVSNSWED